MPRTTASAAVLASALLGLTLLTPPGAAAVGETCQGRPATVVGAPGTKRLMGTEGPDVVVTAGARATRTLGGDDLVCVTGGPGSVETGDGDDVVDATSGTGAWVVLGAGADRFAGSSAVDSVISGGSYPHVDVEADVVDTGPAGEQDDVVESGAVGLPNPDQVTMGLGTLEWDGLATSTSVVDGGGSSRLRFASPDRRPVAVDVVRATASIDGAVQLDFRGFTRFALDLGVRASRSLEFRGSDQREELEIITAVYPLDTVHDVELAGGDDQLVLSGSHAVPSGVRHDGGDGRDVFDLRWGDDHDVRLNLAAGELRIRRSGRTGVASVTSYEDAYVLARGVVLRGDAGRNDLSAHTCRLVADGGGGADTIAWVDQGSADELLCLGRRADLSGGAGNDALRGSPRADRITGGGGRDVVHGRGGRDVCSAEVTRQCEVRR